jgi:hypothetical protein
MGRLAVARMIQAVPLLIAVTLISFGLSVMAPVDPARMARYARQAASSIWQSEDFGTSLPVPSFIWDLPESGGMYLGSHIVGAETVDGVETRAQGHFMDHGYADFDAPLSIVAPS